MSDISEVSQIIWLISRPVTIHLKTDLPFGRKLWFVPNSRGFNFLKPNPVGGELKEMARVYEAGDGEIQK